MIPHLTEGLAYRGGALQFEGVALETLADRFGTPLYVYSEDVITARLARLRRDFAALQPLLCYAMKANSNPALCRSIARAGAGVEAVSGGELHLALRAGFPARRTLFSGVGKTRREIREGLRAGILLFNVESEQELDAIEREAKALGRRAPVSVRLNPDIDAGTHRHVTTGKAENKFGLPVPRGLAAFRRAAASRHLKALGLHVHIGSQIRTVEPYRREIAALSKILRRLESDGLRPLYVDIGGGMGVPYGEGRPLDTSALAREAAALRAPGRTLILEPGRFLVAEAGLLLARVLYVKRAAAGRLAVLDAGMTDLLRPALYGASHPIVPAREGGRTVEVEAVGPICESSDSFGRARLPEPKPGDLWAILVAGAYGFSMASQYNGRPRPAEAIVSAGRAMLARRRETYQDLL